MADEETEPGRSRASGPAGTTLIEPPILARSAAPERSTTESGTSGPDLLGQMVGSIKVVEYIGSGGFGEVYRGYDEKLGRKVALKSLRVERMWDQEGRARFLREARMLSQLDHPNICRIHDLVTAHGREFLVLELLSGVSLARRIEQGCPRPRQLAIAEQVARALAAAHEKGIVHRDLKPDNVMITGDDVVKVLDFGVARPSVQPETVELRSDGWAGARPSVAGSGGVFDTYALGHDGLVAGTPYYMSPEQARGEPASPASDLYGFGLLLQELLSGRRPRAEGPDASAELARASRGESLPFEGDDRDLVTLVSRLKSLAPASRPSALDAAERLSWIAAKPRRRKLRLLAAGVAAALVATTAVALVQGTRASRAAARAEREAETAEQVSEFLTGLFKVSDPGEATGRTITAREILDRGARKVDSELAGQPLVQARLMATMGTVYVGLGLYRDAEPLLAGALATQEKALGPDHLELASSLDSLAELRWRQDRFAEAESLHRRALAIREKALSPVHPDLAKSLNGLGIVYRRQRRFSEAEPLYQRALAIREKALGPDHPDVAESLNDLAILYGQEGKYAQAEPLLVRALGIRERLSGPGHVGVASFANNLATLYWTQGRFADAEPLYRRALAIRVGALGTEHPQVALSTSNLAALYLQQGRYAEALPLYREAARIWEKAVGPRSRELAGSLMGAAACLLNVRALDDARSTCDRSLGIVRELAATAPKDRDARSRIGRTLLVRGRIEAAMGQRDLARTTWLEAVGVLEPLAREERSKDDQSAYAQALLCLGRVEEARPVAAKLLKSGYKHRELLALCREHGLLPPQGDAPSRTP